jgi:hypothetical protein
MLPLFRSLLYIYPAAYRAEYGEEMMVVLMEVHAEAQKKDFLTRTVSYTREAGGLLQGALLEHARTIFPPPGYSFSPQRRFTMRSEFRFPKTTVALMIIILLAVMTAIEKAKAISQSVPHTETPIGPIQPAYITIVPTFLIVFAGVCVCGALLWAVLFAFHRSGVQRLSDLDPSAAPRSRTGLLG